MSLECLPRHPAVAYLCLVRPSIMREIFVDQDHARVGFYKSILDEAGIPNFIRNESTNNTIVGMPSALFFPALCVVRDEDYDRAMKLLGEIYYAPPSQGPDWRCPKCEEEVPASFDSCWQCGTVRPDSTSSDEEPD